MARRLYTVLFYCAVPIIVLRLLLRSLRAPDYRRRIGERFGRFAAPKLRNCIWIHAVSVGETVAAEPVVRELQKRYPQRDIVVTTMTPTGSERVRALFGDTVFHVYAPYDIPWAIRRFLRRVRPSLLLILETELWPNTLDQCRRRGIPAILINARLSARSAIGYQNLSMLSRPMLQDLSAVVAQTQADANRFQTLGLAPERLRVSGSIKFDITLDAALQAQAQRERGAWGAGRPVWIGASTHAGEDEILLEVHRQLLAQYPALLLVLVPRHPERFNAVAELVERRGFSLARRSQTGVPAAGTQVLVCDTMGELLLLYGIADIAFVGGSLVERGGHNMLEAAAWARPIVTGSSDFNFLAISDKLQQAGALVKVASPTGLAEQLRRWLDDEDARQRAGQAAVNVVSGNRGALQKLFAALTPWLQQQERA